MSSIYYPERGFFIGKAAKCIGIAAVVAILAYPATIQADTVARISPIAITAMPTIKSTAQSATLSVDDTQTVWVTAYTSAPDETSDHPLITASGQMVRDGIVADNLLPFGTQIEIPALFGNKVFTVEDRTSQKFSGRVDIWMPSVHDAIDFGIEHAQIVVLDSNLALR